MIFERTGNPEAYLIMAVFVVAMLAGMFLYMLLKKK